MLTQNSERRRAPRYPIRARVVIHKKGGEPVPGVAVDISSSGMLVHPDRQVVFDLGEDVTVEVELPADFDPVLSPWGVGRVVRLDGARSAIELRAGKFSSCSIGIPKPRR